MTILEIAGVIFLILLALDIVVLNIAVILYVKAVDELEEKFEDLSKIVSNTRKDIVTKIEKIYMKMSQFLGK